MSLQKMVSDIGRNIAIGNALRGRCVQNCESRKDCKYPPTNSLECGHHCKVWVYYKQREKGT